MWERTAVVQRSFIISDGAHCLSLLMSLQTAVYIFQWIVINSLLFIGWFMENISVCAPNLLQMCLVGPV